MLLTAVVLSLLCQATGQIVHTRSGTLQGARVTVNNKSIDMYFKIPYARPPTGNLRFRPPQHPDGWSGVRDARKLGPQCPQPLDSPFNYPADTTEDCLFLNVYTPSTTSNSLLPVMVFIHGGAYYLGTGNYYNAGVLASYGVVVVTINYRLGPLGFLSTEDAASPGNYGLLDQIRALEWVRDSISAFNGDPNDVTIFGQSAGSSSVSLLVMSRSAKGLFHKAIMQSGVSMCPWAVGYSHGTPGPREVTAELAVRVGCPLGDSSRMVNCLRTKDAMLLAEVAGNMSIEADNLPFRPVAETTFGQYGLFAASPETLLSNGWFSNVTTIRGFNSDEYAAAMLDPDSDGFALEEFTDMLDEMIRSYIPHGNTDLQERVKNMLLEEYVNKPNITSFIQLRTAYNELLTDLQFVAPTIEELQLTTKFPVKPQYLYKFSYRSQNRLNPTWKGAGHGDDLTYVFGKPLTDEVFPGFVSSYTQEDVAITKQVMKAWTNFAKNGNPAPDGISGAAWLPWTQSSPDYLEISSNTRQVTSSPSSKVTFIIDNISRLFRSVSVGTPVVG